MKKERDSGIELLRIFAIFMVIGVHIFLYGNYYKAALGVGGYVAETAKYFRLFFRPAVDIFVIITGYFMARSAFDLKKSYKRLLPLYLTIYFYSVVLSLFSLWLGPDFCRQEDEAKGALEIVLEMLFPVFSQQWYFVTDYIFMCLFAPFANIIFQSITKRQYQLLIVISTVIMSLWINLMEIKPLEDILSVYGYGEMMEGKNLFSFLYIYMLGGYIGIYGEIRQKPRVRYLFGFILFVWMNYYILAHYDETLDYYSVSRYYSNPFVVLSGVCALLFFKDLHFYNRAVNILSSTTFGIYVIHEFKFMREFIWGTFDFKKFDCSNLTVNFIRIIAIMLLVFSFGSVIDLVRQRLFRGAAFLFRHLAGRFSKYKAYAKVNITKLH